MRLSGIHLLLNRALIFSTEKFLATCTTSVPPTSSFPANKAASYAVTRLQLLFAARNLIPFRVGAQHCCAPASHNVSDRILIYVGIYVGQLDNPCPFINLPPLGISCLSFRGSSSLFSIVCSLFWQNTWGWVPLRQPGAFCLPWYSACIDRGQYRFEAVQTRGKGTFSSSSFLLPCRPAHFPRRRRSLSWTLSRTIFGATCASLNVTV